MNDETVIRKLIADGDGTSEDKRIVQVISLLKSLCSSEEKDKKTVINKIFYNLDQIEFSIKKHCIVSNVLENDTKNIEELFINIDSYLERELERMEIVKEELSSAKAFRKNNQEYDALAKLITERPSRSESINALKQLQSELDEDQEKQKLYEQKLNEKRRNMYSLAILLNNLDKDDLGVKEDEIEVDEQNK